MNIVVLKIDVGAYYEEQLRDGCMPMCGCVVERVTRRTASDI